MEHMNPLMQRIYPIMALSTREAFQSEDGLCHVALRTQRLQLCHAPLDLPVSKEGGRGKATAGAQDHDFMPGRGRIQISFRQWMARTGGGEDPPPCMSVGP